MGITQIAGLSWAQWNANLVMPLVTQLQEGTQPLAFSPAQRSSSPESNDNDPNEDDSSEMPAQTQSAHQQQKGHQMHHTQQTNKDTSIDGGKSSDGESKNGQGYSCPECGRFYKLKSSLRNHQKWECGKEPQFSCPFCVCVQFYANFILLKLLQYTQKPLRKFLKLDTNQNKILISLRIYEIFNFKYNTHYAN